MYRLYSWEHSYFSGKVRAYLRLKERMGALGPGFEDILATPELIAGRLNPRSGSGAVPQMETPDGTWVQDSSEIIDVCEAAHPGFAVIPDASRPKQRLASYLIEFLADEWIVVPAFWQRWYFSEDGREPNHRAFNEQQWGAVMAPDADGPERRQAGAGFFEAAFGISHSRQDPAGVYAGLVHLGCDERTEHAWQASQHRVLQALEVHFGQHDYVLGGRPSLGDFGLLGPLYAHLYRDAIPGLALRTFFPLVAEWVERTNGEGALNARQFGQTLYGLDDDGELVPRLATSDGAEWLDDDAVPETLEALLDVFFTEMWPVLREAIERLRAFVASDAHSPGGELPGKTFTATPGFVELQTGDGPLTQAFEIDGVASRRMVVPYQIWMLGRIAEAMAPCLADAAAFGELTRWLARFEGGREILDLDARLAGARVEKRDARLYSVRREA
ncbi:MAG: glutathione S-transferase C-terminal domain-containing protein [bacterium]|nr:glutathione S-transferase C-terminal domain-containing protein [bacterium]